MRFFRPVFCLAFVALATPVLATEYFVAVDGSNLNPGTREEPWQTLEYGVAQLESGDTLTLREGVYRTGRIRMYVGGTPEQPLTIQGASGEKVVVRGSVEVHDWEPLGDGLWVRDNWGTDSLYLFVAGRPLQRIGKGHSLNESSYRGDPILPWHGESRADMFPGSFYYDGAQQKLYVMLYDLSDPNDFLMEAAVTSLILGGFHVDYVHLRNLTFEHASQMDDFGNLVVTGAEGWVIEGCTFRYAPYRGLFLHGKDHVVRNSTFQFNGGLGMQVFGDTEQPGGQGGYPQNLLVENCKFLSNNILNYNYGFSGGLKAIPNVSGLTVRNCQFENNTYKGVWFDHARGNNLVENCIITGHETGIFWEVCSPQEGDAYGLLARGNLITNSSREGIRVAASSHARLEDNILVDNDYGIYLWQYRHLDAGMLHSNTVRGNLISGGRIAIMHDRVNPNGAHTSFEGNFYHAGSFNNGQLFFDDDLRVTVLDTSSQETNRPTHRTIADMRASGFESSGSAGDPLFLNAAEGDYRLSADSPVSDLDDGWRNNAFLAE